MTGTSFSDTNAAAGETSYYVVTNDCGTSNEASATATPVELETFAIED